MRRKDKRGWEKRNNMRRRNRESIDLLEQHATEFLTKYCIVAYGW